MLSNVKQLWLSISLLWVGVGCAMDEAAGRITPSHPAPATTNGFNLLAIRQTRQELLRLAMQQALVAAGHDAAPLQLQLPEQGANSLSASAGTPGTGA